MACISVIVVNVTRISSMGLSQWHYDMLHTSWTNAIINATVLGLTIGFCVLGVRRELFCGLLGGLRSGSMHGPDARFRRAGPGNLDRAISGVSA
jgi:hypothetical protein